MKLLKGNKAPVTKKAKIHYINLPSHSRTILIRGENIGKTGKTAVLPKFSDTLILSQKGGQISPIIFVALKKYRVYAPDDSKL